MNTEFSAINKNAIARAFNRSANTYDISAFLQKKIGQILIDRLDFIKINPHRILDLGGGTGFFSEKLANRFLNAKIMNLDIAVDMLKKTNVANHSTIACLCSDAEMLPFAKESFDFIFSNCALQWFSENITQLFNELNRILKPGGLLLFSTFGPNTLNELKKSFASIDDYNHVNQFISMQELGDALISTGFLDPVIDREDHVLMYKKIFNLLKDLKNTGAHHVIKNKKKSLNSKSIYKKLSENYKKTKDFLFPATFEVLYGHAFSKKDCTQEKVYRIPLADIYRQYLSKDSPISG